METLLRASRFLQPGEHKTIGKASSMNNLQTIDGISSQTLGRTLSKTKDHPYSFGIGEVVTVLHDRRKVEGIQRFNGKWIEDMEITIGREGVVRYISFNGDVSVEIEGVRWFFNPKCLTKEDFSIGDTARVIQDENKARKLQYGLGEWSEAISGTLGEKGQVVNVYPDGCVEVYIAGKSWAFNPKCLVKTAELRSYSKDERVKIISNGKMLSMIQGSSRWKEGMEKTCGKHGRVESTLPNGDVEVRIEEVCWIFSQKCIYKSNGPIIQWRVGDHVKVINDEVKVRKLQELSQLWIKSMELTMGKRGMISRVYRDGSVRVEIEGNEWNFNPDCLILSN